PLFLDCCRTPRDLHSFPTRRSSDLSGDARGRWDGNTLVIDTTNFSTHSEFMGSTDRLHTLERLTRTGPGRIDYQVTVEEFVVSIDRKSTRLNSSHVEISYAVFCLKK